MIGTATKGKVRLGCRYSMIEIGTYTIGECTPRGSGFTRGRGAPPGARQSPGRTVVRTLRTSETAMSREILVRYLHTYSTGVTRPSALKPRPLTL